MPRYMVERIFPDGFRLPVDGANALSQVVAIHEVSVLDPYFYH